MARKSSSVIPPDDYSEEQDELLPAAEPPVDGRSTANEINLKVQHVQEQLLDLKRQQEEIERQKRELEELSRKQRDFDEGRRDIVEKLTRGLILLERHEQEAKRELEQIKIVRDNFSEHLQQTETLNPSEAPGRGAGRRADQGAGPRRSGQEHLQPVPRAAGRACARTRDGSSMELASEYSPEFAPGL